MFACCYIMASCCVGAHRDWYHKHETFIVRSTVPAIKYEKYTLQTENVMQLCQFNEIGQYGIFHMYTSVI